MVFWLLACTSTDGETGATESWTRITEDNASAFLSVTGSAADDIYAVGADAGAGPAVVHYDGSAWTTIDTGTTGDLWWVAMTGEDLLWMAGAEGRVIRWSKSAGTGIESVLDPALTVFGVWGAADDDVWAVGGDITATDGGAQVWHWDGVAWTQAMLPTEGSAALAMYKVWGRSASDVYVVGTGGVGLQWDGAAWSTFSTGTTRNLFTVSGSADQVWAVGGFGTGTIVTTNGAAWTDETPSMAPQLNGVSASGPKVVAVGVQGAVLVRGEAWEADPRGVATPYDLHAVYVDPDGGIWTVGGKISSFPLDHGIVAYGGAADIPLL